MKNIVFSIVLCLSSWSVVWSFEYADKARGYDATGGEVFTIVLPLAIVTQELSRAEHQITKSKQREKKYQQKLKAFQGI